MNGEKTALTAVALALVLLKMKNSNIGVVLFDSEAKTIKPVNKKFSIEQILERFLEISTLGYTHIEKGLQQALIECKSISHLNKAKPYELLLITDGKYTAGKDPVYLASRFEGVFVLKMGEDQRGDPTCLAIAEKSGGDLKTVSTYNELPDALYNVIKTLS